jgi:hypothetical protein
MNQEKSMPIKEDFANSFMKGRISGFLSIFFGVASFLAVLCFLSIRFGRSDSDRLHL